MESNINSFWNRSRYSLWSYWIVLTLFYLILGFSGIVPLKFTLFIGLFVPIGFFNLMSMFTTGYWGTFLSIPVLFLLIFSGNKQLNKFNITGIKRIVLNLILLFIFTIIIDLIIWHTWQSINFLTMKSAY